MLSQAPQPPKTTSPTRSFPKSYPTLDEILSDFSDDNEELDFLSTAHELHRRINQALDRCSRISASAQEALSSARRPFSVETTLLERRLLLRAAQPRVSFAGDIHEDKESYRLRECKRTDLVASAWGKEVNETAYAPRGRRARLSRAKLEAHYPLPPDKSLHFRIWLETFPEDPSFRAPTGPEYHHHRYHHPPQKHHHPPQKHHHPPQKQRTDTTLPLPPHQNQNQTQTQTRSLKRQSFTSAYEDWIVRRDPKGPRLGPVRKEENPEGEMVKSLFG
ncbi:hypothetical protein M409DRAFT_23098 [Zasmidium cellare ATCC 36951]|uniref:Uncharacterized protein n=1 Tax=Zasmidium cellare ATCC 36951 TaxID=1080233 RepID=A0A6A6CJT3_ZASCE|nr:uncharacterized protein M409DRAFT_23098 [Zasmidium cellare ATCC 36951]KAF2166458.1 hypothetical protein M409DRAFT_23098 [Zasmidium cellare ATCC 36951]